MEQKELYRYERCMRTELEVKLNVGRLRLAEIQKVKEDAGKVE